MPGPDCPVDNYRPLVRWRCPCLLPCVWSVRHLCSLPAACLALSFCRVIWTVRGRLPLWWVYAMYAPLCDTISVSSLVLLCLCALCSLLATPFVSLSESSCECRDCHCALVIVALCSRECRVARTLSLSLCRLSRERRLHGLSLVVVDDSCGH
jgi:hypothetical protein